MLAHWARSATPQWHRPHWRSSSTPIAALATTGLVFRAVEYRDIYPGITMRLSFEGRSIKADYIVAPGADPPLFVFDTGGTAALEETGDLIAGEIRQPAPIVLQDEPNAAGPLRDG